MDDQDPMSTPGREDDPNPPNGPEPVDESPGEADTADGDVGEPGSPEAPDGEDDPRDVGTSDGDTDDSPASEDADEAGDDGDGPGGEDRRSVISLYRHPLAAVGGAIIVAGTMAFIFLVFQDLTSPTENIYRSLVTFVAVPGVIGLGVMLFLLAIRIQIVQARKRGEKVRFVLRVEPTDPRYMRSLWLFLILSAIGVAVVGFVGFKAYEATDSTAFCGETCHTPMEPEAVAHKVSPHAQVACVDCHIGSGGEAYIQAKINGMKQLWGVLTDSYDRPVETPIEMRPAEEICEECHWRDNLWGTKVKTKTYYSLDDASTPWTMQFLLDLGAQTPTSERPGGVHWHTSSGVEVDYIATDEERQDIPWVRVTEEDGTERIYTAPGDYVPPVNDPETEVRRFDCLDCHNRPAHPLEPASESINRAISEGLIPATLPEIKDVAMQVLLNGYEDREAAHEGIPAGLESFYSAMHPEALSEMGAEIDQAAAALIEIYDVNFFPEMDTDYRVRQYNIGHLAWQGCFRCHDGEKVDEAGDVISDDCNSCHLIVSQGPTPGAFLPPLESSGLEFEHPFGVTKWRERSCTSCHSSLDDL